MQGKRLWSSPTGREKVAMVGREQEEGPRRTGSKTAEKKRQTGATRSQACVGLLSGPGDDSINMLASRGAGSVAIRGKGRDKRAWRFHVSEPYHSILL